jgi:hypothetical protein
MMTFDRLPGSTMRALPTSLLVCAVLVAVLVGCGGGGGGSDAGDASSGPIREAEPNDVPGAAMPLGSVGKARTRGEIAMTANDGVLSTGDLDLWGFTASADGRLGLELTMPDGADFDLSLLDASGLRLATSRANNLDPTGTRTEVLSVEVRSGRSYLVEVGGFAGAPGAYDLRIDVDADDHAGAVSPPMTSTTPLGSMGTRRCFHAAVNLPDGGALVAGGTRSAESQANAILDSVSSTEILDPETCEFSPGPSLGGFRFGLTGTALPDGRVLLAGGDLGGTADLYDPLLGGMVAKNIPLASGLRFLHTASLLPCGRVLLAGGVGFEFVPSPSAPRLATTEIFDPKTRTFAAGPVLSATRFSHAACVLADGRVLIAGGEGRSDSEIVDLMNGAFTRTAGPALTGIRDDHTATTLHDGRVLVLGGQGGSGASLATAEILDDPSASPASVFRALSATMGADRADHQVLRLPSGQVLVFGGEDDPGTGAPDAILATVDLFDPATESFTAMPDLIVPRDDHRIVRLLDGRVLVTGGEDAASLSIRDVEAYDPR